MAWNLALKAAGGLSIAIAGLVLQVSGYAAGESAADVNPMGLRWLLTLLPALFGGASALLLAGLSLDENEHRRVRQALAAAVIADGALPKTGFTWMRGKG